MFTAPIEKEPAVKTITQTIQPNALRFPGGTIANYYHPDGLGYGFRQEDVKGGFPEITRAMPLFDKNAIYHFADLCRMSGTSVVYVANMMTGTVEETIWAIEYFRSQNIPVAGIELGNEFYLQQYRDRFPTVETYIKIAKEFAAVLRKKFPQIPLGVVAANPTEPNPSNSHGKFQNLWNATLGKESFYDFYIPHLYSNAEVCQQKGGNDLKAIFDCTNLTLAPVHYNYMQVVLDHYKQFFGNKKIWITEWNSEAASYISNSVRQAEFVGEFLMDLIDVAVKNPQVEYAFFHNYGSGGYVSPIFTYTNEKNIKYLRREGNIAYNATYFPFLYLRQLVEQKAIRINEKVAYPSGLTNQNVVFKTFVSSDSKNLFVFFINKTSQKIAFEVEGAQRIMKAEGIQGNFPWSVAGLNGLHKSLPDQVDLIQYIPQNKNAEDYTVPANSIGYLVISL